MQYEELKEIVKLIAREERQPCSHPVIQSDAARGIFQRILSHYPLSEDEKRSLRGTYQDESA